MVKKEKLSRLKVAAAVGVVLLLVVLAGYWAGRREADESTEQTTEAETTTAAVETTAAPTDSPETDAETEPVVIDLPDKENLIGRLMIEEIGLDEYLMQGDRYLDQDNDGNYALQGSLYLPGYSTDECIFVNGHTMKDGSKFGNLYKQRDELIGMKVTLQIEDRETEYRIVKTYIVSGTNEHILKAIYGGEYKEYLEEYQDMSVTGTVLSLMCCEYSQKDGRLFVVAEEI